MFSELGVSPRHLIISPVGVAPMVRSMHYATPGKHLIGKHHVRTLEIVVPPSRFRKMEEVMIRAPIPSMPKSKDAMGIVRGNINAFLALAYRNP